MLRTWLARRRHCAHPQPRRHGRLRLECLEDRTVPSTFTVTTKLDVVDPADGKLSLREAITKANDHPGPDTIVLPAGVFKTTIPGANEDNNATGDFDIRDPLTIRGAGAGLTIVDGQQLDRVFDVFGSGPSSIKVVFAGLTVHNGNVDGHGGGILFGNADLVVRDCVISANRASLTGGGISNATDPGTGNVKLVRTTVTRNVAGATGGGLAVLGGSTLTVTDSTVRRNIAANGGGIDATAPTLTNCTVSGNSAGGAAGGIDASTATLTNCTVSGNTAATDGGGIFAFGTATLTNCTVSGNSAGGAGGGIIATTASLTNCAVSGNSGTFGGGIDASTATLTNCTVSGNSAGGGSGGIDASTATLTNCTVSGNSAGGGPGGGGILAHTATLTNCTVSGNSAATNGGGIFATAATLLNCTLAENFAHIGGGLFHNPGGTFSIRNTIVALNLTDFAGTNPDVSGDFTSQGHNLLGDGTGGTGFTNGVNGDIVGTAVNPIDPGLGALKNNGGRTKTHALLAGSPAIDAGDNTGALATDQRGRPRRHDGNGDGVAVVDIGAFER